jgi:hypothetical protein
MESFDGLSKLGAEVWVTNVGNCMAMFWGVGEWRLGSGCEGKSGRVVNVSNRISFGGVRQAGDEVKTMRMGVRTQLIHGGGQLSRPGPSVRRITGWAASLPTFRDGCKTSSTTPDKKIHKQGSLHISRYSILQSEIDVSSQQRL